MNYYIVRAIWGGNDMSEEFIKNNYWENGYDDKFVDLINNIKIPSIFVLAGKDNTVINIGKCLENYKNGKKLYIEWNQNFDKFKINNLGKYQKTIQQIQNKDIEEKIKNYIYSKKERISQNIKFRTKNIMLYGAPGVGKTHNYKKLVALIEGRDFTENEIFDFIINNKDDEILEGSVDTLYNLVKDEKRIEFVTFHQSYSYEDFIEGFRPHNNGNIKLEDGILKNICFQAKDNLEDSELTLEEYNKKYNLLRNFRFYAETKVEKQESIKSGNVEFKFNKFDKDVLYFTIIENDKHFLDSFITFDMIRKYFKQTLNDIYDEYIAFICSDFKIYMKKLNTVISYDEKYEKMRDVKNFYIVIDEINRGNISKIFGELITLIEEDKRDDYEVTLPYSKEKFKIPSNLYIIATMNSTDKSIATIDIALRRRFTFLKMKPKEELVKNEKAKDLMQRLNKHISETINEDYTLGHSYFMKIENENDLEFVKEYKIKPLLEEYFYGDEKNFDEAIAILNKKEDNQ